MTAERDKDPAPVSRRILLRGAAAAVPTILTLHSGAALARTSNCISLAREAAPDGLNRNLCVDLVTPPNPPTLVDGNLYDLGEPPAAKVTAIPVDREYRTEANNGANSTVKTPGDMCESGGTYWYKDDSDKWTEAQVPRGMMASATALGSFTGPGSISIREI